MTQAQFVLSRSGAAITKLNDNLKIISTGLPLNAIDKVINSGSSGITAIFFAAFGLEKRFIRPIVLDCSA